MFLVSSVVFGLSIEARCLVKNEDVVGATPTGNGTSHYIWVINNLIVYKSVAL